VAGDSWLHGGPTCGRALDRSGDQHACTSAPAIRVPISSDTYRKGKNLYSDSVVALDISGPQPTVKWYTQLVAGRYARRGHRDAPQLFTARSTASALPLIMATDKGATTRSSIGATGNVLAKGNARAKPGMDTAPTLSGQVVVPITAAASSGTAAHTIPHEPVVIPATDECGIWTSLGDVTYSAATRSPAALAGARRR